MRNEGAAGLIDRGNTVFGFWSRRWTWAGFAMSFVALLVLFNRWPESDIAAAGLFWSDGSCGDPSCGAFRLGAAPALGALRKVFHYLPPAIGVTLLAALLWRLRRGSRAADPFVRKALAGVTALLAGPLFLVNVLLKEHVGRPRPHQTTDFGGQLPFVPAGDWHGACQTNCSFVSGEVSGVAWLVALLPLCPAPWRPLLGAAVAASIAASALLRMAFGAHFLSDVALAALLSVTVYAVAARLLEAPLQQGATASRQPCATGTS